MNLSALLGAVLLACASSAFGRSLNTQPKIQGLTPNPPSLNSEGGDGIMDFLTALSWPIPLPDTYDIPDASLLPITSSGMPSVLPDILSALPEEVPINKAGFDDTNIPSIIGPSTQTTSTIPEDFLLNLQNMKNKQVKYCIYELSPNKRQLESKECGDESSNWSSFTSIFDDSKPGFALYRLGDDAILFLMNLRHDCQVKNGDGVWTSGTTPCSGDEKTLESFETQWLNSIKELFFHYVSIDGVRTDTFLNDIGDTYIYSPKVDPTCFSDGLTSGRCQSS